MKHSEKALALWKWIQIGVAIAVLAIALWLLRDQGYDWKALVETANPWRFFAAMAILPVFGFPISICYLYAGMTFTPAVGIAACLGALAVNMSLSFALMRSALRKPLAAILKAKGWQTTRLSSDSQFRLAFVLRVVPGPPFFFQNLALALSSVPFGTYLWASLLGQGTIACGVVVGSHYFSQHPTSVAGIAILALACLMLAAKGITILRRRRLDARA